MQLANKWSKLVGEYRKARDELRKTGNGSQAVVHTQPEDANLDAEGRGGSILVYTGPVFVMC